MLAGLAPGTRSTYHGRQLTFISYCSKNNLSAAPADELTLLNYLAFLFLSEGRSASTCSGHLSAIRNLHILNGFGDPFVGKERLALVKRGIAINTKTLPLRAAVTDSHIRDILGHLDLTLFDDACFFAMCVIGYFGFFRVSEITHDKQGFNPANSLTPHDVTWEDDKIIILLKNQRQIKLELECELAWEWHRVRYAL